MRGDLVQGAVWTLGGGTIVYASIIFAPDGAEARERLKEEQAKDL